MHPAESADHRETFASVLTDNQRTIGLKDAIGILRIDNQVREVEWAPDHPLTLISLVPGRAAIVGDKERAFGGLDKRVNALGIRRSDRHCKASVRFLRETLIGLRGNLRPGTAAVRRTK